MSAVIITIIICLTILVFTGMIVGIVYINTKLRYSSKIAVRASIDYLIASISNIEQGKESMAKFESDNKEIGNVATEYYRKGWKNGYVTCKNDIIEKLRKNEEEAVKDINYDI